MAKSVFGFNVAVFGLGIATLASCFMVMERLLGNDDLAAWYGFCALVVFIITAVIWDAATEEGREMHAERQKPKKERRSK